MPFPGTALARRNRAQVVTASMKEHLKSAINALLQPLGFELRRHEPLRVDPAYYLRAIGELQAAYTALGEIALPENETRAELLARLTGTQLGEAFALLHYLNRSETVPGAVCEFGIASGATSALMANEMRAWEKQLWLFDSFEGLPRPTEKDVLIDDIHGVGSMAAYEGRMAFARTGVEQRLKAIAFPPERVVVVPGFIEETATSAHLPEAIAFAYIDFDLYEPIRIGLDLVHQRMPAGGHIVVDDYGFFSKGAQTATDEFLEAHPSAYKAITPAAIPGHFRVLRKTG